MRTAWCVRMGFSPPCSMSAGPPVLSREALKLFEILPEWFVRCLLIFLHQLVQVFGKDRPDCMESIVPAETFRSKTGQRIDHRPLPTGNLILDNDVNNRMKLRIRQRDPVAVMVGGDQIDALDCVGVQPVSWRWRRLRVV